MAQITDHDHKSTGAMAKGGVIHPRKKHSGGDPQPDRRRHVTAEEIDAFKQLYEQGFTGTQIAALTGWGKSAVYRHLGLGNPRPRWTDEDNQILVDGYLELKHGEICRVLPNKLGRSRQAVYAQMCNYRKRLKADPKKTRALRAITMAFRAVKKADIFRESERREEFEL